MTWLQFDWKVQISGPNRPETLTPSLLPTASSRLPAAVGLLLLVAFTASPFLLPSATMPSRSWMTQTVAEATRIYGSGGFADVLASIRELPGVLPPADGRRDRFTNSLLLRRSSLSSSAACHDFFVRWPFPSRPRGSLIGPATAR
jgi:hypothetical protein